MELMERLLAAMDVGVGAFTSCDVRSGYDLTFDASLAETRQPPCTSRPRTGGFNEATSAANSKTGACAITGKSGITIPAIVADDPALLYASG